jgi:hypothetical protein
VATATSVRSTAPSWATHRGDGAVLRSLPVRRGLMNSYSDRLVLYWTLLDNRLGTSERASGCKILIPLRDQSPPLRPSEWPLVEC